MALKEMYLQLKNTENFEKLGYVCITHADCVEDANSLAGMIQDEFPSVEIIISDIGPVIGAHTGPGGLAMCYLGNVVNFECGEDGKVYNICPRKGIHLKVSKDRDYCFLLGEKFERESAFMMQE